jgi:hypothetical protein
MSETPEQQRIRLYKKRLTLYDEKLIKCLECSLSYAKLGSHVVQVHGYETAKEYRKAHGLDWKTGKDTTIASYRNKKSKMVKETGNINNLKNGAVYRFKKGGRASEIVSDYWKYKRENKKYEPTDLLEKASLGIPTGLTIDEIEAEKL